MKFGETFLIEKKLALLPTSIWNLDLISNFEFAQLNRQPHHQ
jgi:hypothetical protein